MRRSSAPALALLLACGGALAQTPDWLAGCWRGEAGSAADGAFELWTTPRADQMLGVSQTVRGQRRFFEYMRIEVRNGRPVFIPQPNGKPPVEFPITEAEPARALFANPAHDFPKYVDYARTGDALVVQLSAVAPGAEGRRQRFAFRRVACDTVLPTQ